MFVDLSWDDLRGWAGSKIVTRGRSYQRQNLVSKLAILDDECLIAWVDGTHRYAARVTINEEGLPDSICTCPYGYNCKHGVAVVLEYLRQIEEDKRIPKASKDDERLLLFDEEEWEDDLDNQNDNDCDESSLKGTMKSEVNAYLDGKTKTQLTELILELAGKFPQIAQELTDRKQLASGDIESLINRLKKEIREISSEPGWQNYWQQEGYTPDYSGICIKLETLLKAGHADEVLMLGKELIQFGNQQIEESHDEGETATEIEECMPVIVKALEQSSIATADKLTWAVDVVLKDDYDVFNAFGEYLDRPHTKSDWNTLADRLLKQLGKMKRTGIKNDFHRNYARDRLSNWIIHALECAGRKEEIIPLCEAEARETGSYTRLVEHPILEERYADAEQWIQEGIRKTEKELPGIASDLRCRLKEIRISQKDWIAVATMQTEEFVRYPSEKTFLECQKANAKTKTWPRVRDHLLFYLEKGELPWQQKGWPLGTSNQTKPDVSFRNTFPMANVLIEIAISEKKPEKVLYWYDQLQNNRRGWISIGDDRIAAAIQDYAPARAVSLWKTIAENLIHQTKPSAYEQAARYLRKAEKIMKREKKQSQWNQYLNSLREQHARKRRFIEILEQSDSRPIISKNR
jgi:uncharacterized Zn finger protein